MPKTVSLILIAALIIRIFFVIQHINYNPQYGYQQDNYPSYTDALRLGILNTPHFPLYDRRLFPGYPLLIYLVNFLSHSSINSGIFISLAASLASVYFFWLITRNLALTAIFSVFPPVWINQSTKVSTEPLTVMLLLAGLWLYFRHRFAWSGILIGLAFIVRPISICLLAALAMHCFSQRSSSRMLLAGFVLSAAILPIYNYFIFNHSLFIQLFITPELGRTSFGALQIIQDWFRAITWKQYRILISGSFYVFLNLIAATLLFLSRRLSDLFMVCFLWMIFSLIYIFSASPTPLLEEFSRFSTPFIPAMLIGLSSLMPYRLLEQSSGHGSSGCIFK
jgi:Gpi18-like mannosyltransferase